MSEGNHSNNPSELAQSIGDSPSRLIETLDGDGTTHTPIYDYLNENEEIRNILTANGKSIAKGNKGNTLYSYASTGEPTYVFTGSRILALMPQSDSDEVHNIAYSTVVSIENHFGWTKSRMELHTQDGAEYHLWLKSEDKKDQQRLETFINERIDVEKQTEEVLEAEDGSEEENETDSGSQERDDDPDNDSEPEYSFTAKKKGMKIEENGETIHLTSEKGSKSKFEFTDKQFIATIPQESDDEIFVVDYESIDDVGFSSGFRKNRIDVRAEGKLYKFWTKDSVDSNELMEVISEGAEGESITIDDLLFENEEIQKEYNSRVAKVDDPSKIGGIALSNGEGARIVFTDDRFLAVVPKYLDDKSFSADYDSIVEIEVDDGNQVNLYTSSDSYRFWTEERVSERELIKFIYDKIRGNDTNKLAESLGEDERIRKLSTSQKKGLKISGAGGHHTKPEIFEAKFVFTDNRLLAYIPQKESSKLSVVDYDSIVDFESSSGMTKNRIDIHKGRTKYTFWTTDRPSGIINFLSGNAGRERFELVEADDEKGTLRIEGWTKGSSDINADVNASSESKGKSFGVQGGPFFASKTASKSSIKGDISGQISDNTYTAEIEKLKVYKQNLTLKSGVELDIHLSEIENVFKQQNGLVIEVAGTTFRMGNLPSDAKVSEAVSYIKDQMTSSDEGTEDPSSDEGDESENSDSEDVDTAEKLRELKSLHEDGILTDEEFETKKEELLDDF